MHNYGFIKLPYHPWPPWWEVWSRQLKCVWCPLASIDLCCTHRPQFRCRSLPRWNSSFSSPLEPKTVWTKFQNVLCWSHWPIIQAENSGGSLTQEFDMVKLSQPSRGDSNVTGRGLGGIGIRYRDVSSLMKSNWLLNTCFHRLQNCLSDIHFVLCKSTNGSQIHASRKLSRCLLFFQDTDQERSSKFLTLIWQEDLPSLVLQDNGVLDRNTEQTFVKRAQQVSVSP